MEKGILEIVKKFDISNETADISPLGEGHINCTYLVRAVDGKKYVLQKISRQAFPDVEGLMENIISVTDFLRTKNADPRAVLRFIPEKGGKSWLQAENGDWRMYHYVEDSICLQSAENAGDFYQSAIGFGKFQYDLRDFPAEKLHETIKDFHNTPDRYRKFSDVIKKDPLGRAKLVQKEIDFALSKQEEMSTLQSMRISKELPLRVTHNDTKLNNVLLDEKTHKALCVIDLDTVMPGLSAYDFGDSIRFGAATAAEDETDLSKVGMDISRYEVFTEGFLSACPGLSQIEKESLPMGAKTMTMENGIRFLTDFIDGDHYYAIHRPEQNLDRARTQFRLFSEMDKNWDLMRKIIEKY